MSQRLSFSTLLLRTRNVSNRLFLITAVDSQACSESIVHDRLPWSLFGLHSLRDFLSFEVHFRVPCLQEAEN
jgi:hypothetical protein